MRKIIMALAVALPLSWSIAAFADYTPPSDSKKEVQKDSGKGTTKKTSKKQKKGEEKKTEKTSQSSSR